MAAITRPSTWAARPATSRTRLATRAKIEFSAHLTKATPALCQDCHDVKSADLIKAHQGQPFGNANCLQCHNPHQSQQAKLMQQFTHSSLRVEELRYLPRSGKRRQGGADQQRYQGVVRYLPQRSGRKDREGESTASRRAGRMHHLPQSARRKVSGIPAARSGQRLPGLPQHAVGADAESAPAPAGIQTRLLRLP